MEFHVDGPKFALEPGSVHELNPSPGVEGDYVSLMPSLTLNRITLPWERTREGASSDDDSWMMLFMVTDEEKRQLTEGKERAGNLFTGITERYQDAEVNYLTIPSALDALFPAENEYQYLSYCREDETDGSKKAVILCNRLPQPGSGHTVYLLSLEHSKRDAGNRTFPVLYQWSFQSTDITSYLIPKESPWSIGGTEQIPLKLTGILYDTEPEFSEAIKEQKPEITDREFSVLKDRFRFNAGTFHGLLHRLPGKLSAFQYPVGAGINNAMIKQGGAVLSDDVNKVWYRGPLQANPVPLLLLDQEGNVQAQWTGAPKYLEPGNTPTSADQSYQVAHELGRLMALRDQGFHKPYFEWKQEISAAFIAQQASNGKRNTQAFPIRKLNVSKPMPKSVQDKINGWKALKGIPIAHLVPSSKFLPPESIRLFCADRNWINAFILGALSVGNTYDSVEGNILNAIHRDGFFLTSNRYGFCLNSLAVSGWPEYNLMMDFKGDESFELLHRKKLSKNIEFYLFDGMDSDEGAIQKLTFQLPTGKSYSGFRYENKAFKKQYNDAGTNKELDVAVNDRGRIDINGLATNASPSCTPAYFGMMLQEGTPKVVFEV